MEDSFVKYIPSAREFRVSERRNDCRFVSGIAPEREICNAVSTTRYDFTSHPAAAQWTRSSVLLLQNLAHHHQLYTLVAIFETIENPAIYNRVFITDATSGPLHQNTHTIVYMRPSFLILCNIKTAGFYVTNNTAGDRCQEGRK